MLLLKKHTINCLSILLLLITFWLVAFIHANFEIHSRHGFRIEIPLYHITALRRKKIDLVPGYMCDHVMVYLSDETVFFEDRYHPPRRNKSGFFFHRPHSDESGNPQLMKAPFSICILIYIRQPESCFQLTSDLFFKGM